MDTTFFDDNIKKSIYDQFLTIWVQPEIENRKELGLLPHSFNLYSNDLYAAQVIFFPDNRNRIIRLNDEVIVRAKVKLKEPLNYSVGDKININQFESYENFVLAEEDFADCGHITMRRLKNTWTLVFDARYNKELAQKHIKKATEFYKTAKYDLKKGYFSPFVDNLFSTSELTAKAILLTGPYKKLREKSSHMGIQKLFIDNAKLKNIKIEHKDLLNKLSGLRNSARYLRGDLKIDKVNAKKMLKIAKDMMEFAELRIRVE